MSTDKPTLPFVLAMTGASGSVYGLRLLQYLLEIEQPVEMLLSKAAIMVMREEMDLEVGSDAKAFLIKYLSLPQNSPLTLHDLGNYGATVSSGSYRTKGMAIVPCSVGTLGALAAGLTENLIQRAAAVTLKEQRKLLILIREMPFGQIQLKNMLTLSQAGAIVSAASPGFYHKPQSISDQVDFVVGRVLDQFEFDHALFKRWKGNAKPLPCLTGKETL